jgi:NADH dehydrogenase
MKNKLVTLIGGGGFLGRYIAQELLSAGARVRIAQRDPREAWFLKPLGGLGQTQFAAVDIRKPDTVLRAVRGSDAVVNLAGILSGNFQGVHVAGAKNVAEAAAAAGVPALVHVSAIGADPESPSAYGRSKAEGEAAVRAALPGATILRPSIMFGREDHFINRFAGMIASAPIVPVLRAEAKFQPVYVRDVARAAATVLARQVSGDDGGAMFELGGPDILSMGQLIRWIAKAIGRDPMIVELPDTVGGLIALGGFLPGAPITLDQWRMLQRDNVAAGANGLAALGVTPTPLDAVAPDWLVRYRRHGRFGARVVA